MKVNDLVPGDIIQQTFTSDWAETHVSIVTANGEFGKEMRDLVAISDHEIMDSWVVGIEDNVVINKFYFNHPEIDGAYEKLIELFPEVLL